MSTQDAAAAAKHFLSQFRSLTKFAETIVELGDAERNVAAAKDATTAAEAAHKAALSELHEVQHTIAAEKAKLTEAKKVSTTALTTAKEEAATIIGAAKAQREEVLSKARSAADALLNSAAAQREALDAEMAKLAAAIKAGKDEHAALQKAIDGLKRKFA